MRDYRWFKILLRAMGLLLLGLAIPNITGAVESAIFFFRSEYRTTGFPYWQTAVISSVGALGGRIDSGKQMPCEIWPRSFTVLMRNPAGRITSPAGLVWAGLKLLARRKSNSARSGSNESISQ